MGHGHCTLAPPAASEFAFETSPMATNDPDSGSEPSLWYCSNLKTFCRPEIDLDEEESAVITVSEVVVARHLKTE